MVIPKATAPGRLSSPFWPKVGARGPAHPGSGRFTAKSAGEHAPGGADSRSGRLGTVIVRFLLIPLFACIPAALSPFLGPSAVSSRRALLCHTCLQNHGALRGSLLSVVRVCKCHPFHPGGIDPPLFPEGTSARNPKRTAQNRRRTGRTSPPS